MNKSLIIDRPELQTPQQRYIFSMLTLVFWIIWFYLWLPLLSLFAWLLGFEYFYENMIRLNGLEGLLDLIGWYGLVIGASALLLVFWSAYNLSRFQGKNKRTTSIRVTEEQMAEFFHIDKSGLQICHHEKRIVFEFGQDGSILDINGQPQGNISQSQAEAQSVARHGAG